MKAILLAADAGHALRPLTDDRPTCMVEVAGRPLLHWQMEALRASGVDDMVVVRGWSRSRIHGKDLRFLDNPSWAESGTLESLRCALRELRGEIVVLQSEWLPNPTLLRQIRGCASPICQPVNDKGPEGPFLGVLHLQPRGSEILREELIHEARRERSRTDAFGLGRPLAELELADILGVLREKGLPIKKIRTAGNCVRLGSAPDRERVGELLRTGHFGSAKSPGILA